jgi:surfeit locus 1 family protein
MGRAGTLAGVVGRLTTVRALGLLVVAVLAMTAMVAMGVWQYHVYDSHQRADAVATMRRAPVPLDHALGRDQAFPSDSVGVPVTVTGRYDATDQLYVEQLDGAHGRFSVVTPLVAPSGSAVLVVRGSTTSATASTPPGPVTVTGILEPSGTGAEPLDAGRVTDGISVASLVGAVHRDLYAGYVVLTTSRPAESLTPVTPPLPDPSRWAGVRNLLYALQWWVFAGFVGFMWWRIVTDTQTDVDPASERSGSVAT